MGPQRKLTSTVCIVNVVASVDDKREETIKAMTAHFETTRDWLNEEIQCAKRKILDGMMEDDSKRKKIKSVAPIDKENNNPNMILLRNNAPPVLEKNVECEPSTCLRRSDNINVMSMLVRDLQKELRDRGLDTSGKKAALQKRLLDAISRFPQKEDVDKSVEEELPKSAKDLVKQDNTLRVIQIPQMQSIPAPRPLQNATTIDEDIEMEDASAGRTSMDVEPKIAEENIAKERSEIGSTRSVISAPKTSTAPVPTIESCVAKKSDTPVMNKKAISKSISKAAESLFSPKKSYIQSLQTIVATSLNASAKKKNPLVTAKAPFVSNLPIQPAYSVAPPEEKEALSNTASKIVDMNKNKWNTFTSKNESFAKCAEVPALSTPALAPLKKSDASSGESSTTSTVSSVSKSIKEKQKALQDARKARLAEIRGKSKPVALPKSSIPQTNISMDSKLTAKASSSVEGKGETRKLLAPRMREKAAAAMKKTIGIHSNNPNYQTEKREPTPECISVLSTAPTGSAPTAKTPVDRSALPKQKEIRSPMDTYDISDREESDSEDDSSLEDAQQKKNVPKWALKNSLIPALEKQFAIGGSKRFDPDSIFPEVQSCDLEAIFDQKKTRYNRRTSSGNWTKDRVTVAEKMVYKRNMGYTKT